MTPERLEEIEAKGYASGVILELLAEVRRLLKLNATLEENRIAVQKRCTELLEELRDARRG